MSARRFVSLGIASSATPAETGEGSTPISRKRRAERVHRIFAARFRPRARLRNPGLSRRLRSVGRASLFGITVERSLAPARRFSRRSFPSRSRCSWRLAIFHRLLTAYVFKRAHALAKCVCNSSEGYEKRVKRRGGAPVRERERGRAGSACAERARRQTRAYLFMQTEPANCAAAHPR